MSGVRFERWIKSGVVCAVIGLGSVRAGEPTRVGSETCAACHDEIAGAIRANVHGKTEPEGACESCHGPGSRHVEEGNAESIGRFGPGVSAGNRAAPCLTCHGRDAHVKTWASSEHATHAVACDECHDPHAPVARTPLLRKSEPELCYGCHGNVRAQFQLTERHPVGTGSMKCTDCHNPHAASDRGLLGGFKQDACLRCHSEYRGPWTFEHEAVAVEGCVVCHTPHGSVNRHLLTYQRVGDLCLQCHPGQPYFHDLVDGAGRRTTGFNDCTRCHTEIHGSNNDALFLN